MGAQMLIRLVAAILKLARRGKADKAAKLLEQINAVVSARVNHKIVMSGGGGGGGGN